MGLFGGKKEAVLTPDQIAAKMAEEKGAKEDASGEAKNEFSTGNPKVDMILTKMNAQLEGHNENRKVVSDRFTRIGEQIGELRGMIIDTNKTIGQIEVASTKAVDLVESVQPEKLMIEVRKIDGRVEALKANIEANESLMKDLMAEMKKMRSQMNFYKGVEQVAKLNEDIKKEVAESKKVQAVIERHSDKVETIFLEVSKKFAEFDKFADTVKDMNTTFKVIQGDFDKIKVALETKSTKKDMSNLVAKFNDFEKHTGNIVKLLDEKTKSSKRDLDEKFSRITEAVEAKHQVKVDFAEKQKERKGGLFARIFRKKGEEKGEKAREKIVGKEEAKKEEGKAEEKKEEAKAEEKKE